MIELWLCVDCTIIVVNDDATGFDSTSRVKEVRAAVNALGSGLACNSSGEDSSGEREFSSMPCDCCGSHLAGSRTRFALFD